jgi:hypothetical protein
LFIKLLKLLPLIQNLNKKHAETLNKLETNSN